MPVIGRSPAGMPQAAEKTHQQVSGCSQGKDDRGDESVILSALPSAGFFTRTGVFALLQQPGVSVLYLAQPDKDEDGDGNLARILTGRIPDELGKNRGGKKCDRRKNAQADPDDDSDCECGRN